MRFLIAKYGSELKKKVFQAYLDGTISYEYLATHHKITACSNIKNVFWLSENLAIKV